MKASDEFVTLCNTNEVLTLGSLLHSKRPVLLNALVYIFPKSLSQTTTISEKIDRTVLCTLRSQIEGYTRLLIFRKLSTLPAVI